MYLLVMMVGVGLLSPALSLTCYQCPLGSPGSCTSWTAVCPPQRNRCASGRIVTYAGSTEFSDQHEKACVSEVECTETSVNYGVSRSALKVQCCLTDRCNNMPAPRPTENSPNGRKCYTCDGKTCKATLKCLGTENSCITSTVTSSGVKQILKGCASKLACDLSSTSRLMKNLTNTVTSKCCQGDLCNGAVGISAGLLLLLAPLLAQLFV
ncbi:uncharacterized protein ACB058_020276 [Synchiropus picturatus]